MHWMLATFLLCLSCSSRRIARELGVHVRTGYRWCWWLRNAALSYEIGRQLEGTVEADDLYHTAGQKGPSQAGREESVGTPTTWAPQETRARSGHYDKDRPAIIAWVSRQGAVVLQATRDFTVKTVQKAADLAVQTGSRLYTDSASSYRALTGYLHEYVNHTKKEYARGEVHENRAECLFSLLKPYLRVFRGISKMNLPGYGILPIPAQLSSTDGVRAGRDDFVCGAGPGHCQQSQTGRFCQMSGPLQPATNREKLSEQA